jgi:hypothetical protein
MSETKKAALSRGEINENDIEKENLRSSELDDVAGGGAVRYKGDSSNNRSKQKERRPVMSSEDALSLQFAPDLEDRIPARDDQTIELTIKIDE